MSKLETPQKPGHLGYFQETQAFGKFPKDSDISGIPQVSCHLGNFQNFIYKPPQISIPQPPPPPLWFFFKLT